MRAPLVAAALLAAVACAYRPLVLMHGFSFFVPGTPGSARSWDNFVGFVHKHHPGQQVFALDVDEHSSSSTALHQQVRDVAEAIGRIIDGNRSAFAHGFHLVGHSQGALIARCVIEKHRYNIENFVSIAGVQTGFYGDCGLPYIANRTCEAATQWLYTKKMQKSFSIANMWRTTDDLEYLAGNTFLPHFNNEGPVIDEELRDNLLSVGHLYFFASPHDIAIRPWYSGLFGFWDADFQSMVPMQKQRFYVEDTFGLRTMDEQGRLTLTAVDGVSHTEWHDSEDLFIKYFDPILQ
eukprot:m51a1_g2286 hypothetical protein (293) ;mRNA; f:400487-401587